MDGLVEAEGRGGAVRGDCGELRLKPAIDCTGEVGEAGSFPLALSVATSTGNNVSK